MQPEYLKDSGGVKAQEAVDEKETVWNRTAPYKTSGGGIKRLKKGKTKIK